MIHKNMCVNSPFRVSTTPLKIPTQSGKIDVDIFRFMDIGQENHPRNRMSGPIRPNCSILFQLLQMFCWTLIGTPNSMLDPSVIKISCLGVNADFWPWVTSGGKITESGENLLFYILRKMPQHLRKIDF